MPAVFSWLDMTLPMTCPVTTQSMVAVFLGERQVCRQPIENLL
jgi:hypothetical protein